MRGTGRSCASRPMTRHATFEDVVWAINGLPGARLVHGTTVRLAYNPGDARNATASRSWVLSRTDAIAPPELAGKPGFEGLGGGRKGPMGLPRGARATQCAPTRGSAHSR
jgi:hypothetical protein